MSLYRILNAVLGFAIKTYYRKLHQYNLDKVRILGIPFLSGNITIGSGVLISSRFCNPVGTRFPCYIHTSKTGEIDIGLDFCASGVIIYAHDKVTIGNNVLIAPNVLIADTDFHPISPSLRLNIETVNTSKSKPIHIEDNVWIGYNVTILKGTRIGYGSVIGSGCIIDSDIPPNSLVKRSSNCQSIDPIIDP